MHKHSKIAGVILAAGASTRMGEAKQLLPFRGKPMLAHVMANALKADLFEVIAVLGYAADTIKQQINFDGVKVVIEKEYEKGQSIPFRAGLRAVSDTCDAILFLLSDLPLIDTALINAVIEGYHKTAKPMVVAAHKGRRGHPVIIDRSLFSRLDQMLKGDAGARKLLEAYPQSIQKIEVATDAVHFDIDTRKDYEKLLARYPV